MNAKQSFKSVYALVRTNRRSIHFRHQFFRFAADTGSIFIADAGCLVISRNGAYVTEQPGYVAGCLGSNSSFGPDYRRHTLDRSREVGRVPLP